MAMFFLVWKSLNISFDEPIPSSLVFYDFSYSFWNLYTVLAPPKLHIISIYNVHTYKSLSMLYAKFTQNHFSMLLK